LSDELKTVNEAAKKAARLLGTTEIPDWVLSVGSTPTAHAASRSEIRAKLRRTLLGKLEIHAGGYFVLEYSTVPHRIISRELSHA
jgi:D-serine deaminase-like pyridoxal phosphate-dependent protein